MKHVVSPVEPVQLCLENIGELKALGWEPQPPRPPTWKVSYTKGGKTLQKKRGSWYIDDDKIGRLSDKRLIAKLKTMPNAGAGSFDEESEDEGSLRERDAGQAFMSLPFELRVTEKKTPHGPPAPDDIKKTITRYYDDVMASLPAHMKSEPEARQKEYAARVAWTRFCKYKDPSHSSCSSQTEGTETPAHIADGDLWQKVLRAAKAKFDPYPSAYANAWAAREYQKRGGTYRGKKPRELEKAIGRLRETLEGRRL
jgi:hypothetical protein